MTDWQAAAIRMADDFEELRRVHVAQQPIAQAAVDAGQFWRQSPTQRYVRQVHPELAAALDYLGQAVERSET